MTINTKELQRFYDVWGPMITSLPAVINAAEHQAELSTNVERLQAQLQAAIADRDKAVAEKQAGLAVVSAQLHELTNKKREATLGVKAYEKECAARVAAATAKADADVTEQMARAEAARVLADRAAFDLDQRLADAEKAFAADAEIKRQELADIDARRANAEAALAELKAKL